MTRSSAMIRMGRCSIGVAVAAPMLLMPASASAQWADHPDETDWRREDRPVYESPQSWAFEMRFGPYKPRIDEEFDASPGPYERIFGDANRVFVGAEVDYQAFRIPWVGTFGPGVGWQFTKMSGVAKVEGTDEDSAETARLWIMPMYLVGVLRIDVFSREAGVPLVPYGKLGAGYALWKASNDLGTSSYDGVSGKGHSAGWQWAAGLALQLDPFDRRAAAELDESAGVNHSYLYFEWMNANLDNFGRGDHMRVGATTWAIGLTFEI